MAAAERLKDLPELTSIQAYAGTAAPFNFNGLVRHYYLRDEPQQGDLAINLVGKGDRSRASHAIALDIRHRLADLPLPPGVGAQGGGGAARPAGARHRARRDLRPRRRRAGARSPPRCARRSRRSTSSSTSTTRFPKPAERLRISIDQEALEFHGVDEQAVYDTIGALLGGTPIGFSQRGDGLKPIDISVALPRSDRTLDERLLSTPLPAGGTVRQGANVELGDVVKLTREPGSYPIYRHNGRFAEMVTAEVAGRFEAPIYAMLAIEDEIAQMDWGVDGPPAISYHGQPENDAARTLLWDGEWEVTYVTFRDMGAAFMVAILGIYLLVVAQFGSFKLPLVILTPVPLTLIGIMLGHWMLGAPFTATSMIGFIALAGIIVRNSILLVDFIRRRQAEGAPLRDGADRSGRDARQADRADRRGGDDRLGVHSRRPDLPGARHLAGVRPRVVDRADPAGDPGDLHLAERRRTHPPKTSP